MALGDQIGESSGRITGTRVITPLGSQQAQIEVAFQGSGTLLGQDITEVGTHVQSLRPGGELSGEGDGRHRTRHGARGGALRAQEMTEVGPAVRSLRPGGVLYGEGDVLYITSDGESAHWKGFGVGRPTGPFPAGHFAVCGSAETESQALSRFNEIATVTEYDADQEGNYRYAIW